ncbi:S8 family serine peptidase [Actinomadura madurae]|uniref:S53 family peptidase n=1 Tax=Actinomadura madurae TaxID=1993 RepID=UPI0020273BCE|nr:S8 family serine peptidase [Actinomadura madurae]URN06939.1 S8 family serine peptidase [Actinomadura madurae]
MPLQRTKRRARRVLTLVAAAAIAAGAAGAAVASPPPSPRPAAPADAAPPGGPEQWRACDLPAPGHVTCLALVGTAPVQPPGKRAAADDDVRAGYTAADIQDAYNLPSELLGSRQTIAIVGAFDSPKAESDLAVYRKANNLPACGDDFPCFRKVDQRGGTDYPPVQGGWAVEMSVDLQMASAACPNCRLLLVEADDSSFDNIAAAVDTAVRLGADVVSNSYGSGGEFNTLSDYARHYDHPGTIMVAAAGDTGFGNVGVPAVFGNVIAVGGTTLARVGGRWTHTAWNGTSSACSAYVAKPRWQHDRLCAKRSTADVAAVADPAAPVLIYDTYAYGGWVGAAGTSVSTAIIAGVYGLAGRAGAADPAGSRLYAMAGRKAADGRPNLIDVTTGFQGFAGPNGSCGGGYPCTPGRGYDGPTGLGVPNGIGAF